jgi:uncharacterized membrane protein HdeD (DUF308 family)
MFFTSKWWAIVLRGVAAVLFGLLAFSRPGITLGALIVLFAAYALVDGILAIAAAINRTDLTGHWGYMLLRGILSIAASVIAMTYPAMTALALLFLIAGWAIATGIVEISAAIRLRKVISGEWLMVVAGLLSIVFGVALAAYPGPGILTVVTLIGTFAVIFGGLLIGLGFSLRAKGKRVEPEIERRRAA